MDLSIFKLKELQYIAFEFGLDNFNTMDRQQLEAVLTRQFRDVFTKRQLPENAIITLPKGNEIVSLQIHDWFRI